MRTRFGSFLAMLAVLAGGCGVTVPAADLNGLSEAMLPDGPTGSPAAGVPVYAFSDAEYFDVRAGGVVTIRPAYRGTIAITCDIGWGRSCLLGAESQRSACSLNPLAMDAILCSSLVGVPKGSPCSCQSVWGQIEGHAV